MLQQICIYLLKVTCISGLLFLYYHLALRNKNFHYYNRFYLLMAVTISMLLPFIRLEWFTFFSSSQQTIHLYKIIYGNSEADVTVNSTHTINWEAVCMYTAVAVSLFFCISLFFRVTKILRLKKKFTVQQLPDFNFINTDIASAPFSFFRNIFWRNDISLEEETGKQILRHEITHIKQKHSLDKLYMQLVICFFWINPFYHFIKKELYLIHEFIADEKAVKHSDADAFAKMLLTAQFGKFNFLPAQSIFYSSIKRRLIMLTTSKKPHLNYVRRLLALPLLASLICLFAFTIKARNNNNKIPVSVSAKPFVLVVDAGHGGKDYGATGNGIIEKDVTLKIADKIKDLSQRYGIDVKLTRNSDMFMDPKQKSDFANNQNADALISIHINAAGKTNEQNSGFDVLLSPGNEKFSEQNHVLGSAILQNLSKDFTAASAIQRPSVGIWILKNSNIPSALIECGYITNNTDADNLKNDAKIELMATSILQGVAAYANNTVSKSKLYQLKKDNTVLADTSEPVNVLENTKPLYVLNGKIINEAEFKAIDPSTIESVNVLKDKSATALYGEKGNNGVVEIKLKTQVAKFTPPVIIRDSDGVANPLPAEKADKEFTTVQKEAQFPGGNEAWRAYLEKNIDAGIPSKHKAPAGVYTVTVSFLVNYDGKVYNVKALNDPGYGTAKEAVRVIAQGPSWVPAEQNGQKVAYIQKQNISFSVTNM